MNLGGLPPDLLSVRVGQENRWAPKVLYFLNERSPNDSESCCISPTQAFHCIQHIRTKQLAMTLPRCHPAFARKTTSIRPRQGQQGYQRPSPKMPKKSEMDFSAEIRALELDSSDNLFPESTRPRQPPAMTRYHGKPLKPRRAPREKMRHPKSWRKRKVPSTLTDPEVSLPQTNLHEDPPPLTNPRDTHLANPEVPATRRSEPRTQPEVIDLTGED